MKHNLMLETARKGGCTHFVMAAVDHFYRPDQVEYAKQVVLAEDFDVTFTGMYTYYRHPTWQITPIEDYFMPFICKITPETRIERVKDYPVYVDPSVQVTPIKKHSTFTEREVMLHHYSMIRTDIKKKFDNAASSWAPEQIAAFMREFEEYSLESNPGVTYFGHRKIKVVDDYFGLNTILAS